MTGDSLPAVGDRATLDHVFSEEDVLTFANLSGDDNPVHLDAATAVGLGFDGPIVHGMLAGALLSRLLGTEMPGPGTIYVSQDLRFRRPIYPGDSVRAEVEVISRRDDKQILELATRVFANDTLAVDGSAVVLVRRGS